MTPEAKAGQLTAPKRPDATSVAGCQARPFRAGSLTIAVRTCNSDTQLTCDPTLAVGAPGREHTSNSNPTPYPDQTIAVAKGMHLGGVTIGADRGSTSDGDLMTGYEQSAAGLRGQSSALILAHALASSSLTPTNGSACPITSFGPPAVIR